MEKLEYFFEDHQHPDEKFDMPDFDNYTPTPYSSFDFSIASVRVETDDEDFGFCIEILPIEFNSDKFYYGGSLLSIRKYYDAPIQFDIIYLGQLFNKIKRKLYKQVTPF